MFREVRWTDDREEHIARHNVTPGEVEEVLFGRPVYVDDQTDGSTVVLGQTDASRYLSSRCCGRTIKAARSR